MLKSRYRKREKKGGFLPILIPVMNLFLLVLPLVIQNAYLQKLTTLELQLPTISESNAVANTKNVNLVVYVKPTAVSIFVDDKLLADIPVSERLDEILYTNLMEVKKQHPAKRDVLMKVDPQVRYELVVKVIDQCKKENKLFPEVVYFDEDR